MPPSAQVNEQPQEVKKTPLQSISQGACLPGIPKHPTFVLKKQWQLEQMALAFRVFARLGYTDGMAGHISVRDPENPHTFWTNPLAVHFGMLRASDMILVDYQGVPIGAALGTKGKALVLQNHVLLTTGTTVDEAGLLMTLMERASQCQLLAEAAAANGIPKVLISDASAKYTFENSNDPETLYWEGQPDLEYEEYLCKGEHKL